MAEPPYKRSRRPDSKQMWDEADKRGSSNSTVLPSREKDDRRHRGADETDHDRQRRYRSRSPRAGRDGGGGRQRDGHRERERDGGYRGSGGRPDARERDHRSEKGRGFQDRERDTRNKRSRDERADGRSNRDIRDRPRERSKSRDREHGRDARRSRSPRQEPEKLHRSIEERDDGARSRSFKVDEGLNLEKSRTATPPPVSFKVGGQADDRMELDQDSKASKKIGKSKSNAPEPEYDEEEEEDDIVVEDDGQAAMQAMMGFGGFGTTHQKKVPGNDISAIRREKKTEYRQYMNRVGGFNRELSPPK